jgi:DNA (cytosine-5)-methyltransferase 1
MMAANRRPPRPATPSRLEDAIARAAAPPTVGSLFSGVGGFDLGFIRAGFDVRWQCEIDRDARDVLCKRFPETDMIYTDVRTMPLHAVERVDVLIGGFPCQDLSVAGRRAGLDGERSGLFFDFARIIGELRPALVVMENVPGLLSSNGGRDMAVILGTLCDIGARDIGWAVLDAQWFGVPQRRRRVFIVADFAGERASAILALPEGLQGHPPPRRTQGEDVAPVLSARASYDRGDGAEPLTFTFQRTDAYAEGDAGSTLAARESRGPQDLIASPLVDAGKRQWSMDSPNFVTHSLTAAGADASEDGTGRGTPLVAIRTANTNANGHGIAEDVTHALDGAQGQAVAFTERTRKDGRNFEASPDLAFALTNPGSVGRTHSRQLMDGMGVRRLTPTECERLMSWEDGHTQYGASGKEMSDSTRYRMCGNGVVSNVAEYLARRIREVL